MCVILVGEINSSLHKQAAEQNRDGFSLFNEQFGLVKAPTKAQVEASFGKFGIWHYRIGTSGRMDVYNVHPFPVCKGKYLLYHNGVLGSGVDCIHPSNLLFRCDSAKCQTFHTMLLPDPFSAPLPSQKVH